LPSIVKYVILFKYDTRRYAIEFADGRRKNSILEEQIGSVMKKEWFFDCYCGQRFAALMEDGELVEFTAEKKQNAVLIGNVYKGKVTNVLSGMNAAFINCGLHKNCYLSTDETYADYTKYDGTFEDDGAPLANLKEGDEVLVQITKPPRGTKGAKVSTRLSFVGKRLIYLPNTDFMGISRKITDEALREQLLLNAENMRAEDKSDGYILRTQAPFATKEQLEKEAEYLKKLYRDMLEAMDSYHIADALAAIFRFLSRANKYIDETTPWTLAKDPAMQDRLGTVLYNLLESIRWGAVMLTPFIPETAEEILRELGTDLTTFETIGSGEAFSGMKAGESVGDSKVLFARIDEEKKLAELEAERLAAMAEAQKEEEPAVEKPEGVVQIGIDDFMKVDLRTAKILACEKAKKAKKLLVLTVDLGYEKRQIVSGIAKWYAPEELIGKKVVVVSNLKPAVLCGIESNGMLLASGEETVRVIFLAEDTPLGERIH
jgi:methionine--tRNA ligase beta chain